MEQLQWQCDGHGTQILHPTVQGVEAQAWIQARRTYCDRGHWEWGNMGVALDERALPQPSYYFMRRDNAIAEIEEWLARMQGVASPTQQIANLALSGAFSHADGAELQGSWTKDGNDMLRACIVDQGNPVAFCLQELPAKGGPVFVLSVEAGMEVDGADRFPRAYMDLGRAMEETEAFLAWRVLKHPTQIPGLLSDPPRSVGEILASVDTVERPRSKPRRR